MRLTRAIAVVGLVCMMTGAAAATGAEKPQTYVVRAHDTLYSIAWRHHLDYRDLAKWNAVGADFHLSVGQVLSLRPPGPATRAAPPRSAARAVPVIKWVWPTARRGPPRPVPGGGILLLGEIGQSVRAAGAGKVVYTGSGLRGYGNLIIIKHGDTMLSSYAHNRELSVREGQDVAAGQIIGHMGTGAHQIAALYFEIRVNGKPTDPLRYLPAAD